MLKSYLTANTLFGIFSATLLLAVSTRDSAGGDFELLKSDDGVTIKLDGQLFTRYLIGTGPKPIMWPLMGPDGSEITRSFPMKEGVEGERADHPHHRSFWFTHGDVNGVSFWHEGADAGSIVHREFLAIESGSTGLIKTRNDWIGPDDRIHCQDVRSFRFDSNGESRWIDAVIVVTAVADEVVFGDTKEGSFGVRVAGTIKEDADMGGRIMTSEGLSGGAAWGKPASWVDYHGPVNDSTVGIAILTHPSSYGYPMHWHVRTYGLFAANPFGLHDFYGADSGKDGSLRLAKGESFTLKFRVLIHPGDHEQGAVAESFAEYAETE